MKTCFKHAPLLLLLMLSLRHTTFAQTLPTGPQVLTFHSSVDDTEQPYGLYLPPRYDAQKKYPLVIMLHGAGSNHRLALRRVFGKSNANGETDVEASRYFPKWADVEYIVASPYARGTMGYQDIPEQDVYAVLDDVKKRFNIDEDRTYLTGLSMGGGGTLWIGLTRPDIWAAMAPVCAAAPAGTDILAPNALNVPMYFFHGDADRAVPVERSREMVQKLKDLGTHVVYTEYEGVGHNSWENAYADGAIFDWFGKFRRNPYPDEVRFVSSQYKYNHAYWVQLDKLTPGTPASIHARFTAANELTISTTALDAFTLTLAHHPNVNAGQPLRVTLDGKKIKATANNTVTFVKTDGKWSEAKPPLALPAKQKGAEGPLAEAFATRHIYVYGTADHPDNETLKARIETAQQAANWSEYRGAFLGRVMVFPRVVADHDVRPSDLKEANLILFGTKETNTLIAGFSDRLPAHLRQPAAGNYGLFYIFPVDHRYLAISSGLPWWTGSQAPFMKPQTMLRRFEDFILFKGSPDTPVAAGRFTDDWTLPAEAITKMKDSGAVDIK